MHASVDVTLGSLSPGPSPSGFVAAMGEVIRAEQIHWPRIGVGVNGYWPEIVVDEMGVQSIPSPEKSGLYEGIVPDPALVDDADQAQQYAEALALYACAGVTQVNVFHLEDDADVNPWALSGIEYPDGSAKPSYGAVKDALERAHNGTITVCPGEYEGSTSNGLPFG
jgi:hypothetical protein